MTRPGWARWLDVVSLPVIRLTGRLLGRPSEAELHALVGREPANDLLGASPELAAADHIQLGRSALERGDLGEALHNFGQALSLHPDARWAWHGRGDALQLSGDPSGAEAAYRRAVSLDTGCGLHHAGRANALKDLGREAEADAAWAEALRLDPTLHWMRQD